MSGRLTVREARAAAHSLGAFTRNQFAESIGVTPLEAGKWLTRLAEEESIHRDGREYRWDVAAAKSEAVEAPHAGEDCRIVARRLLKRSPGFTARQLAEAMGISESAAHQKIKMLCETGTIRDSGKTEYRENGKRPVIYVEVPIEADTNGRRKRPPVEVELRQKGMLPEPAKRPQHGGPVGTNPQSGNDKPNVNHPELKRIIDAIYEQGGTVKHTKNHLKVELPSGTKFHLPHTPGATRIPKTIALARRNGVVL